jgi:Mg2+-importing ATPase
MSFGVLLLLFHANESLFQTGWFVESVLSAATIVLVVRSRRPFFKSQPGKWLALSTGLVVLAVLALPLTPLGKVFGFTPMPIALYGAVLGIVATYALSAELLKSWFYKRFGSR